MSRSQQPGLAYFCNSARSVISNPSTFSRLSEGTKRKFLFLKKKPPTFPYQQLSEKWLPDSLLRKITCHYWFYRTAWSPAVCHGKICFTLSIRNTKTTSHGETKTSSTSSSTTIQVQHMLDYVSFDNTSKKELWAMQWVFWTRTMEYAVNTHTQIYIYINKGCIDLILRISIGSDPVIFCGSGIGETRKEKVQ